MPNRAKAAGLIAAVLAVLSLGTPAAAQNSVVMQMAGDTVTAGKDRAENGQPESNRPESNPGAPKKMKPDLLVVPIPMSNPTLGAGITLASVLFYNPNGSSEPWVTGGGAFYTSNKSWGGGAVHSMSLAQDKVKVLLFGGYADINMKFYGIGAAAGDRNVSVKMDDKGMVLLGQAQYAIFRNMYLGVRYEYLDVNQSIKTENPLFPDLDLPGNLLDSRISGIGPSITYDSRDSQFAPRKGANLTVVGLFNTGALGSDFTYNKWQAAANGYFPVTSTGTLAVHGSLCAVSKNGPFYDMCMYGQAGDLRGYEMGRYRDRAMWTTQIEWRQHLGGKFGGVFFAGMGGIADDLGEIGNGKFLPAVGMGLRYKASQATGTYLRLDFAMGRDSHAVYFGIGEVF